MKPMFLLFSILLLLAACRPAPDKEAIKKEIFDSEKAFEKMAAEKGIAEAFWYFAAEDAVIKREHDTLISGKKNIKTYYLNDSYKKAVVNWTPDFVEVSECGTLGYTYGRYVWKIKTQDDSITEYKGVFHTVWKKQQDGSWKYVWD